MGHWSNNELLIFTLDEDKQGLDKILSALLEEEDGETYINFKEYIKHGANAEMEVQDLEHFSEDQIKIRTPGYVIEHGESYPADYRILYQIKNIVQPRVVALLAKKFPGTIFQLHYSMYEFSYKGVATAKDDYFNVQHINYNPFELMDHPKIQDKRA